ncbi:MAG TPA: hypothetical protein DC047_11060 [Blastocatellia bacterium]|nr:hypothetical protein [Blastocatellia bacterium]
MNQKDYERVKRQIEDRYRADLDALERIRELTNGSFSQAESSANPEGLPDKVKQAVSDVDEAVFTKRTLTNHLRKSDPTIPQSIQNAVGGILKRMKDAGEIREVRVGKGKRATEYGKLNGHQPAAAPRPLSLDE